jgi:hypothetical protein
VEVAGVPPVNVQLHEVGLFCDRSEKFTVSPSKIVTGVPEKSATGVTAGPDTTVDCAIYGS